MTLLSQFQDLGCPAPCDLQQLAKFARCDVNSADTISTDSFSFGDIAMRVKFFGSPLFKDYEATHAKAMLQKMKDTGTTIGESLRFLLPASEVTRGMVWAG